MKSVDEILRQTWGTGFKKDLTLVEYDVMMKGDLEISSSMPDSKSDKMRFVKEMQEKYVKVEQHYEFWQQEEERLKEQYPAIHKEK